MPAFPRASSHPSNPGTEYPVHQICKSAHISSCLKNAAEAYRTICCGFTTGQQAVQQQVTGGPNKQQLLDKQLQNT
jgi:hypothetical protein